MSKSQPQVIDKVKEWYNWLVNHVPKPIKGKASKVFKTFKDKIMGLYERVRGEKEPEEEKNEESSNSVEPGTRINLIKSQTHVRTYQVTGSLSHDVSNLILHTICPNIKVRMRVIYSFSCSIYQRWNQVVQYYGTLFPNGTFTSLSQIQECIKQCELRRLNLEDEGVWSKAYLPAVRITNDPGVYEGYIEFSHIHIRLIFWNGPFMGFSPLPDWLC